jgi:hypothetical protein
MTEQPRKQSAKQPQQAVQQPDKTEIYGMQGNEGQYGQGQYDSEGKPDPHGPQAQQIQPDITKPTDQAGKPQNQHTEHTVTKEDTVNKKKAE